MATTGSLRLIPELEDIFVHHPKPPECTYEHVERTWAAMIATRQAIKHGVSLEMLNRMLEDEWEFLAALYAWRNDPDCNCGGSDLPGS